MFDIHIAINSYRACMEKFAQKTIMEVVGAQFRTQLNVLTLKNVLDLVPNAVAVKRMPCIQKIMPNIQAILALQTNIVE